MSGRKLTDEQVIAFRSAYYRKELSVREIVKRSGINAAHSMLTGVTYADVPGWLTKAQRQAMWRTS